MIKGPPKLFNQAPYAIVACDTCREEHQVNCSYVRERGCNIPNSSQVNKKLSQKGWKMTKRHHYCPSCLAQSKEQVDMPKDTPPIEQPKQPTRRQKRDIMAALEGAYDTENQRYVSGESDQTVADVCEVVPGWVAEIREEFFGSDGANDEIIKFEEICKAANKELADMQNQIKQLETFTADLKSKSTHMSTDIKAMTKMLDAIKKSVGPSALRRAGVT